MQNMIGGNCWSGIMLVGFCVADGSFVSRNVNRQFTCENSEDDLFGTVGESFSMSLANCQSNLMLISRIRDISMESIRHIGNSSWNCDECQASAKIGEPSTVILSFEIFQIGVYLILKLMLSWTNSNEVLSLIGFVRHKCLSSETKRM